jgi:Asp/Glu/hydantoin racemase
LSVSIVGLKAVAAAGAATVLIGGGAFLAGNTWSSASTDVACVAPVSEVSTTIAARRLELSQVLTPAGGSLVATGTHGLGSLRHSLREAMGCEAVPVQQAAPAAPAVAKEDVPQPMWRIREAAGLPPHCAVP